MNLLDWNKCPRCRVNDMMHPEEINALSRMNNRSYVCSACGEDEAMLDFAGIGQQEPWPIKRKLMNWSSLR